MLKIFRLVVVLFIITALSGFGLAFLKNLTEEPIEYAQIKELKAPAVAEVFAGMNPENDPVADRKKLIVGKDKRGRDDYAYVFPCKKGGKTTAVAIEAFSPGYSGDMGVMAAIGTEGKFKDKIIKIGITANTETPGKGDRVKKGEEGKKFRAQFDGIGVNQPINVTSIDALSGATVSSQAVASAVNNAMKIYKDNKAKLLN
jgi:Na+-translocating ferredoxin:NAD+ oxidoreductase subunit G